MAFLSKKLPKKFNIGSNATVNKCIEQYEEGGLSSLESQKRGEKLV